MTAYDQLSQVVEIITRGEVAFRMTEPQSMGCERYAKMVNDLIEDGFTQNQACARVASLMKHERAGKTSSGFKLSK